MNWNIYFQAFTVRTWRKRLSNLNTFLTPHIYWGIHITICVNYNQHNGMKTQARRRKAHRAEQDVLVLLTKPAFREASDGASYDDGRGVDDGSDHGRVCSFCFSCRLAKLRPRCRLRECRCVRIPRYGRNHAYRGACPRTLN